MKTPKDNLETMEKWLNEVSINNNDELKQTNKLRTILLNLKLAAARCPEINPIANSLSDIIKEMHDSTDILVNHGRNELRQSFDEIKDYINTQK
jgi:hypothetical protein